MEHKAPESEAKLPPILLEKIKRVGEGYHIKQYAVGRKLGRGGFAQCFEVTDLETKRILAAKIMPKASLKKKSTQQKVVAELKIHKSLEHKNIVKFEKYFEDYDHVCILLELCPHQTLHELIKRRRRLSELEAKCYMLQIVSAVEYMHANNIIHRDLKLGNLFLSDKLELKVGDFGLACKVKNSQELRKSICGTPNYLAPEILKQNGHSFEVDIWALGIILYSLLFGMLPFQTSSLKITYRRIKTGLYFFPKEVDVSDSARNLIRALLSQDPKKRPRAHEIRCHPFFLESHHIPKLLPLFTLAETPSEEFEESLRKASFVRSSSQDSFGIRNMWGEGKNSRRRSTSGNQRSINPYIHTPALEFAYFPKRRVESPNPRGIARRISDKETDISEPEKISTTPSKINFPEKPNGTEKNDHNLLIIPEQHNQEIERTPLQKNSEPVLTCQTGKGLSLCPSTKILSNLVSKETLETDAFLQSPDLSDLDTNESNTSKPQKAWVKGWVDYSKKHGIGFQLSNGAISVLFNDKTIMCSWDLDCKKTSYLAMKIAKKEYDETVFDIESPPANIPKKKILVYIEFLKLFFKMSNKPIEEFIPETKRERCPRSGNKKSMLSDSGSGSIRFTFVKKYWKSEYGSLFKLSNGLYQVIYVDKSELYLDLESLLVTNITKSGEKSFHTMNEALYGSNKSLILKIDPYKDILEKIYRKKLKTIKLEGNCFDARKKI